MFSSVFFCLDFMVSVRNAKEFVIFMLSISLGVLVVVLGVLGRFLVFEDDVIICFGSFVLIGCVTSQEDFSFHI